MSQRGSNAGWDIRSDSHHSRRDDYERAPRPHRSDRDTGSITSHSRTDRNAGDGRISTTVRVTSKKGGGPPISMDRYGANGGFPRSQSHSRSGSVRGSDVPDPTARPPPPRSESRSRGSVNRSGPPESHRRAFFSKQRIVHKSESHHGSVTSKRPESVSSDRTARHSQTRHEPSVKRGSLYEEDRKNGKSVYAPDVDKQRRPRDSIAPSEASNRTIGSIHEMARLSERTRGLNLDPPDDNGLGDLKSVAIGEDHNGQDPSVQSYHKSTPSHYQQSHHSEHRSHTSKPSYNPAPPGSFASGFPPSGNRSHTSRDLALEEYRSTHAPSGNRSHTSRDLALEEYRSTHAPSGNRPYTSRNPPPSYGRGTYVDGHHNVGVVDLTQTHVNVTNIHAPDMSFMNGPSKREKREMRKHDLRSSRGRSRRDDSESDSDW
ncbi:hypothetical protein BCON_0020g00040 [Botryotinia convoluta]|uniref:Uncharacterized protein n=1 Tax=Botryotinia convoluta TaxID=54673 RepID=A0A4Z1IS61_9HELO|nr:hypothetical protein BCON_0020g00040 [Botryotinia convoluta]